MGVHIADPKIVFYDLETLPNLKEVMKIYPKLSNYPGLTLKASITSIICFGYKILGEKTKCINAWDFKDRWKKDLNDDYDVVKAACEILRDADAIVTFNGKRFDEKFLKTRIVKHGFKTLPKLHHIDLCAESKRHLYLFNNSLSTVSKFLLEDDKMENGGWDLWVDVMERSKPAMEKMTKYCIKDVDLLVPLFKKMKPFISNIPNYNSFQSGARNLCPSCGSTRIERRGFQRNKVKTYARYQCKDCSSWSRSDVNDKDTRSL